MNVRICIYFGLISGGFVGILVGLLHGLVCCTPPHAPTFAQLALDGLVVALIAVFIAAVFACLLTRRSIAPVFGLALLIGIVCGILLGPIAYHIANPIIALLVCAVLGFLIGWLICRLICLRNFSLITEVSQ